MPLHNWTLVDDGAFHGFHNRWIAGLTITLNRGLLPKGYYADGEQITRDRDPNDKTIPDIITLRRPRGLFDSVGGSEPGVAVLDTPPRSRRQTELRPVALPKRHIVVRHRSGHQVVALIEIVSPANKDRASRITDFVDKVVNALNAGVHVLVIDVFPPGKHDPHGMHAAVCDRFEPDDTDPPPGEPMLFASYAADIYPKAYIEYAAVGAAAPEVPLFLTPDHHIRVPLEPSYELAWSGTPDVYREVLEPAR
jgi:hypothetical protein